MIAPPTRQRPGAAPVQVLIAEARRHRRRRLLATGVASLALAGLGIAAGRGLWADQPQPGPARPAHPPAAVPGGPGFSLPPATVAWVDYRGRVHVGNVATRAQHVAGTVPAWAGAGWLVTARGRVYGAVSPVIREFDPAAGRTLRLGSGWGIFASPGGRHAYLERTSTSLAELRASGHGILRRLHTPPGWSLIPGVAGEVTTGSGTGILVRSRPGRPPGRPRSLARWDPATGKVTLVARDAAAIGAFTLPGGRTSLIAWEPGSCPAGNCPVEITSTATGTTVTARSPWRHGFAQGAAFSPDGTRLAVFARTAGLGSPCCANNSVLAIVSTRSGSVRPVLAARLVTEEDAGWVLWLPGGTRLLAGALDASYAVDASTAAARPFYFFPQTADGPAADHNIMDTPDINFSAVLLAPGRAALSRQHGDGA